jgi:hypothetical protein
VANLPDNPSLGEIPAILADFDDRLDEVLQRAPHSIENSTSTMGVRLTG